MTSLIVFRIFFGALHILKFKFKANCLGKYKVKKTELVQKYEEIKNLGDSENQNILSVDKKFRNFFDE